MTSSAHATQAVLPDAVLDCLQESLQAYCGDSISGAVFAQRWRAALAQVQLPARFQAVLEQLLHGVESASSFDGEACGFSRRDLCGDLKTWLQLLARR